MNSELLAKYGIDYDSGMRNCMESEDFYKKILSMFLSDKCFGQAKAALEEGDYERLFTYVHELKGISGNGALIELYKATVPLVELLRHKTDNVAEVKSMFARVEAAYSLAMEGIETIINKG